MNYDEWTDVSESYRNALKMYRTAMLAYDPIRDAFRAGEVSDEVFLTAQAAFYAASAAFDVVAAEEASGIEID